MSDSSPALVWEGPFLGIDHGLKFLGLALSLSGEFARPYQVISRQSKAEDFQKIQAIIRKEGVKTLVLGMPPRPPDFVGVSQSVVVRNWAGHLAAAIPLPLYFWEEGLSSEDAEAGLRELGKKLDRVDAQAAALILQACLDAVKAGERPERFICPPA
jgi:putative Holliday junction resolvase